MKTSTLFIVLSLFIATLFMGSSTHAQENESPTMFLVWEEFVSPAHMPEFWKVQSEALKVFDELKLKMTFSAFRTDNGSFYWVIPIKNFAGIDKLHEQLMINHKMLLERGFNPSEKFRDLSTLSQFVILWNKELSYNANPANENAEPYKFHEWTFLYLKAGHEKEAKEACKKYQEFYNGINENYSWNMYQVVLGNHTPCWIMHSSAESEVAMRQLEKDLQNKYSTDFQKLWQNFSKHISKMETKKGIYLPDWSRSRDTE